MSSQSREKTFIGVALLSGLLGLVATLGFSLAMWFIFPRPWERADTSLGSLLIGLFVLPVHAPGGGYFLLGSAFLFLGMFERHRKGASVGVGQIASATLVNLVPLLSILGWLVACLVCRN